MQRQRRKLTVEVAIDLRRKDGWGVRAIARELGRSPSVISTEIGREQDGNYAAGSAQTAAAARRGTPGQARTGRPSICRGGEAVLSAFGASCATGRRLTTLGCIMRRRSGPAARPRARRG